MNNIENPEKRIKEIVNNNESALGTFERASLLLLQAVLLEHALRTFILPVKKLINAYYESAKPNDVGISLSSDEEIMRIIKNKIHFFWSTIQEFFSHEPISQDLKLYEISGVDLTKLGLSVIINIAEDQYPYPAFVIPIEEFDKFRLKLLREISTEVRNLADSITNTEDRIEITILLTELMQNISNEAGGIYTGKLL